MKSMLNAGQKNTHKPGACLLWDLSSLGALIGPVLILRLFLFGPAIDRGFFGVHPLRSAVSVSV